MHNTCNRFIRGTGWTEDVIKHCAICEICYSTEEEILVSGDFVYFCVKEVMLADFRLVFKMCFGFFQLFC